MTFRFSERMKLMKDFEEWYEEICKDGTPVKLDCLLIFMIEEFNLIPEDRL